MKDNVESSECSLRFHLVVCLSVLVLCSGCTSKDIGKWEVVHQGTMVHSPGVEGMYFVGNTGLVLTWEGLYEIRDSGKTWINVLSNSGELRAFYSFEFRSVQTGFIVGTQKKGNASTVLILQTLDGGKSWHERTTDVESESDRDKTPSLKSVAFCGPSTGWAVGDGLILHTNDGGLSWRTQRKFVDSEALFTVACLDSESAWAGGADGVLLHSKDGGTTWLRQQVDTRDTLMRIRFSENSGWIVGGTPGKPALLRTDDKGETWTTQPITKSAALFDIYFLGQHGWIAGENGTILETNDGGQSWVEVTTPTEEDLTSVYFATTSVGWAGGDRKTLLKFSK